MKLINAFRVIPALILMVIFAACSDSSGPGENGDGRITMQAKLTSNIVSAAMLDDKGASTLAENVDSITVSRVRILVTEIKLHDNDDDDNDDNDSTSIDDDDDRVVKTGPLVIDATADTVKVFLTEPIPSGTYDKIKFEFHRFNGSEVGQYTGDPVFGDFVDGDRWSVIIEGMSYDGGTATPFVYHSDITANLSLKFPDQIVLEEDETETVIVEIDPIAVFKSGNKVLDPRDGSNESKIDNAIRSAIKALKK